MADRRDLSGRFPQVAVMQLADNWHLDHPAELRRLDISRCRRILAERKMPAEILIVIDIRSQDALQRSFVEYDHVLQALTAHGTDQPLRVGVDPTVVL